MSYAKVTLVGNVGRDPEFKAVGEGEVCNFTLATNRKVRGESVATWWQVSSWSERLNKIINEYVRKGDKLMLVGEPGGRAYLDRNDHPVCALEINISFGDMVMLSSRREEGEGESEEPRASPRARAPTRRRVAGAARPKTEKLADIEDDDIPF